MAPVIRELQSRSGIISRVCVTGQHRQMLDQVLDLFSIAADSDFNLMRPSQTLNGLAGRIFEGFDGLLDSERPDVVLTHGDTTTAFATSVACFHRGVAVGHVEAGLRTHDFARPFPEEMNRRVVDLVATYLFAPTERARQNLLAEQISSDRIAVTGNTVVDALQSIVDLIRNDAALQDRFGREFPFLAPGRVRVLVTGHRRESFGEGFERICRALARIAGRGDVEIVYPVHLNPQVAGPVHRILGGHDRVHLVPPVDYLTFVHLLSQADVVITDSGGVQEEAISLGKHVIVMREVTERPEGVEAGMAFLVGTDPDAMVRTFEDFLDAGAGASELAVSKHVYGDGRAAGRIVDMLAAS